MNKETIKIKKLCKQFDNISSKAREEIYIKVLSHYKKYPNSPWSGTALVELEKTIKAFYASLGLEYKELFRDTLPVAMQTFYDKAKNELKTAGVKNNLTGKVDTARIQRFMDSSFDYVASKTQNMSNLHISQLRQISAEVFRQVSITGATRKEASKMLLDKALKIKGFEFIDKSNSKWSNKSYFNMLARTELMNAARDTYDEKVASEGFDIMKLTYSGGACNDCAKYEGRLFSLTGASENYPSKDDLIADNVFHPNCTHSYSLVPKAIIERDYKETLKSPTITRYKDDNSLIIDENAIGNIKRNSKNATLLNVREQALKNPESFMNSAIKQTSKNAREYCAVYDANNNLVSISQGGKNTHKTKFRASSNCKVYHTHTTDVSFSATDIQCFLELDLAEIHVKTPNNTIYTLTFDPKGAKLNIKEFYKRYINIKDKHNNNFNDIWEEVFNGTSYKYEVKNNGT